MSGPNIRIVSDGTTPGTTVLFNDQELEHVTAISWQLAAPGLAKCRIELLDVPIDLQAEDPEIFHRKVES